MRWFDAHCHLGRMSNGAQVAREAQALGLHIFSAGVDPRDYVRDAASFASYPNVTVAAGLHPWWVADARCGSCEAKILEATCSRTRWIGEIGLDFSPKYASNGGNEAQVKAFSQICEAAARASSLTGARVLSIHSVRSATACLDILEQSSAIKSCRCVFHWFSGSNDELWRAINAGCWFSVNEMGLNSKRGREYAKLIPKDRLLTETDHPKELDHAWSCEQIVDSLQACVELLAQVRGEDPEAIRELSCENAQRLLA